MDAGDGRSDPKDVGDGVQEASSYSAGHIMKAVRARHVDTITGKKVGQAASHLGGRRVNSD